MQGNQPAMDDFVSVMELGGVARDTRQGRPG